MPTRSGGSGIAAVNDAGGSTPLSLWRVCMAARSVRDCAFSEDFLGSLLRPRRGRPRLDLGGACVNHFGRRQAEHTGEATAHQLGMDFPRGVIVHRRLVVSDANGLL